MKDIERYYVENKIRFIQFFMHHVHPDRACRAEEMAQDVFVALCKATLEELPKRVIHNYAWAIAHNKLKMLFRSKEWQTRKAIWHEQISPQSYDEDTLCAILDGDLTREEYA